ncbi:MAG: lytic transglycosylase domain-containing protein [Prevotella sp.]|jgi:membrane-bound lytic murein transglycosylase D|nr:lytic transglycosylase domain-containing protein [Prevotella sp.]
MKRYLLYLFVFLPLSLQAQDIFDPDEDNDAEMTEDEVTVTDQDGNEEVIDFPEAMTYDLDSLMNLYMSKTYLSQNVDCQTAKEGPAYDKDILMERLKRLPTIMEMPYNEVVHKFIDRYAGRLRHSVGYMLGACNFYIPIFEEALEAYGLPLELKYLPIIESALNPNAVSRVGATGLWQFMLATGKQYGLEVNTLVDERRDPIKASYAAAHCLSDLYKIFGDWSLVIASYNCGPGNINKAIHRAGGKRDYWEIYPYLPRETRGYVPAFIAANYIMTYYSAHNICQMQTRLPGKTDTVVVNRNVHLSQIAAVLDLDLDMLRTLNPEYRRDIVPGNTKPYAIKLAMADAPRFIDLQDSIYNYNTSGLLTKRDEVAVNDETPTFTTYKKNKKGRRTVVRKTTTRKTTAKRRTPATKRKATTAKKRKTTTKRKRRR